MTFTKLEDYFKDKNREYLYIHSSGRKFVVIDSDMYVALTGKNLESLMVIDSLDRLALSDNHEKSVLKSGELVSLEIDEEIGLDDIPL